MQEDSIIIQETIDGRRIDEAIKSRTASKSEKQPSAAAMPKAQRKSDPYIWGIYLLFLVISIIEIFSASSTEVKANNIYGPLIRHGLFLFLGLLIVLGLQKLHYYVFNRLAWTLAIVSLGLLLFSMVWGTNINGAQRAITIAGFTIQPPEIVKFTVVLLLATILGANQEPGGVSNKGVILSAFMVVVFSGCLWVNGLTNMILLMGVSLSMFLIGGIPMRKLMMVLLVYAICGCALFYLKYQNGSSNEFKEASEMMANGTPVEEVNNKFEGRAVTQKGRIEKFFQGVHPEDPITDENRQVWFSSLAQAHGGVIGKGPGNSRESARLPLAFSDYIYSIIVEDGGLVGGLALMVLYLFLLARAGRIAYKCKYAFPAFLIMGCAVMIVFQALVHMAIVTGVFPVSGQPLPFISKGGTSVLVMSVAIGVMLSVSRFAVHGSTKETKEEINNIPENMRAVNMSQSDN